MTRYNIGLALTVVTVLVSCSALGAQARTEQNAAINAPHKVDLHRSAGSNLTPGAHNLGPGDHRFAISSDAQTRQFEIHLPRGYSDTKPVPVFYVLPGASETIEDMKASTNLDALADKDGFAVVTVQALPKVLGVNLWNLPCGSLSQKFHEYNDLHYFAKVTAQVGRMVAVDPRKQYIIGHSEGGAAAQCVARSMPGVFAGVAGVKSTRLLSDQPPRTTDPMAAIFVLGEADQILPLSGGTQNPLFAMGAGNIVNSRPKAQSLAYARSNQCASHTKTNDRFNYVTQYNCKLAPVMEIIRHEGGHTWNDQNSRSDTSAQVVDFLLSWQKPLAKPLLLATWQFSATESLSHLVMTRGDEHEERDSK